MSMAKKKIILCTLVFMCGASFGQTQNYQTYSLFMYSFTRFVQWPPEATTGDFEIAVLGESGILSELKTMAEKKKAGNRTIHVTKINSLSEYKKCHILFVSPDWSAKYAEVATKVTDAPVLLVTEQAAGANKGSINFVNNKEGRLAFELNTPDLNKHHLKASAELVRLAVTN